jgi:hypothetical protein
MPGPFFWFVVIVGLATLWVAITFAVRPAERTLGVLRPLCAATVSSSVAAFLMGIANGLVAVGRALDRAADPAATGAAWRLLVGALSESPAPLILGCAVVSVAWLLVAVGLRRMA